MAEHAIGNAVKPSLTISERQDAQAWLMWGLQQDMQKIWKNTMLHIRDLNLAFEIVFSLIMLFRHAVSFFNLDDSSALTMLYIQIF